jgi:Xaa-Pro aminopeptidase
MFEPSVYQYRRQRLAKQFSTGLLLFPGNDESPMNYLANTYPFRQDSTFLYYWGLDTPGLAAVIDLDSGEERLYGDDPSLDDQIWMGSQKPLAERARLAGVEATGSLPDLERQLASAVKTGRPIHYLPPYRATHRLKLMSWLGLSPPEVDQRVSVPFIQAVVAARSVKSTEEVAEIKAALEITRAMHRYALRETCPGRAEQEVVGSLEGIVAAHGTTLSYPVIFSVRGEVLHNFRHDLVMQSGQMVLFDGAADSRRHYASDITRTFPVDGRFTARQRDIYELVLQMQETALAALRPGVLYRDVHLSAARVAVEGLIALGLMRGDPDEAVARGAHALFFPHGLGHMLGLDVHDLEALGEDYVGYDQTVQRSSQFGLNHLRLAKKLEPGFVLTVEPGIYFIPPLIDRWRAEGRFRQFIDYAALESYRDFGGVRIEDDVLITRDGYELLSADIPKGIEEIEEHMSR